jgi:predicted amidohydrolase YtcJ
MKLSPLLLSLLPTMTLACTTTPEPGGSRGSVLFHHGQIYLHADAPETVEALLVRDGRVVRGGCEAELRALAKGESLTTVDLGGGTAVPGLVDAHGHLSGYGFALESVDLRGCLSYREVIERIATGAAAREPGSWVQGRGWDQTLWEGRAFPHHAELSAAVPDHPVYVGRIDGHAALVNARALELAGLDRVFAEDEDPEGGEIHLGEDGKPSGVLVDQAMELVSNLIPPPDRATLRRRILAAQEALLSHGLVGMHDMGCDGEVLSVLEELEAEGLLRLRVIEYIWVNDGIPADLVARYPRPEDADPARHLRVIGAKLMLDGALGSRGAALLEEYSDQPGELGLLQMPLVAFEELLAGVAAAGLQPATHAIGDRANRLVLDAYARRSASDPAFAALRPRLEHAQIVAASDWPRLAELGVIPSMQPTHATSDMRWCERRIGARRLAGAYAWRHLSGEGAPLAFGSDFPIESPDPLAGLHAARTRQDADGWPEGGWFPEQCLDGREALAAFTRGPAIAAREEDARGSLRPGCFADLTVLDVDPIACPPSLLLEAEVILTIIDGAVVFRR